MRKLTRREALLTLLGLGAIACLPSWMVEMLAGKRISKRRFLPDDQDLDTPTPESTFEIPPKYVIEMANEQLGEDNWKLATNFSNHWVFIQPPPEGELENYVDLSTPGTISVRDPLGIKTEDPDAVDRATNAVNILAVPNVKALEVEHAEHSTREPHHDSRALWFLGNGNIDMTYFWHGDGGETQITGTIQGYEDWSNWFLGQEIGVRDLSLPASFQTTRFKTDREGEIVIQDSKAIVTHMPRAILIHAEATEGSTLQIPLGAPTSYEKLIDSGDQDFEDTGWAFER